MVLAKEKCGRYDCFPVVLQISNHGRVFSDGIALVCRGGGMPGALCPEASPISKVLK